MDLSAADIERDRVLEALRKSQEAHAAGKLMVVHYKCDRLDVDPCRVWGIAAKSLESGLLEYFPGLDAEKEGLAGFGKYLAEHPGSVWLCWNMKDFAYGFPHLSARSVACGLGPLPQASCVDLALVCWRLHGSIKAEGGEKMLSLAKENGLSTDGALTWQKMESSHSGRAIALDARRRVEIIHGLWVRLAAGTLAVPELEREAPESRPSQPLPQDGQGAEGDRTAADSIRAMLMAEPDSVKAEKMRLAVAVTVRAALGKSKVKWARLLEVLGVTDAEHKGFQDRVYRCQGGGRDTFSEAPCGRCLAEFCKTGKAAHIVALASRADFLATMRH